MNDYQQFLTEDLRAEVDAIRKALRPRKKAPAKRLLAEIDPRFRQKKDRRYKVYVIELSAGVRSEKSFVDVNSGCSEELPCLYVGMTARTPEERFRLHKEGHQHSKKVKKYGVRLRPEFYERLNPMTHAEAKCEERELALLLRKHGYGVWQH